MRSLMQRIMLSKIAPVIEGYRGRTLTVATRKELIRDILKALIGKERVLMLRREQVMEIMELKDDKV